VEALILRELETPLRLLFWNWGSLECFERVIDCSVDEDCQVAEVYFRADCHMKRWNVTCSHHKVLYIGFDIESV
jgi:hypothetical protein